MLTLDADVVLRPGAVAELLAAASRLPEHVAQIEGLVHDKLSGLFRGAGHRIYRVAYLNEALGLVPPDGAEIRPEHATLKRLAQSGKPSSTCEVVVGLHDHGQYYGDLYRKSFVHGQKHRSWISSLVPWWQSRAEGDPDYRVVLRGYLDGYLSPERARTDAGALETESAECLRAMGLEEKGAMNAEGGMPNEMAALLRQLETGGLSRSSFSRRVRIREAMKRLGPVRIVPYVFGSVFTALGERLKGMAEAG
jgi:hypothetical protein